MLPILGFFILVLILLYMFRPYYKPYEISSAEFFETIKGPVISLRFNIQSLVTSAPFWVQLLVLGCLFLALLLSDRGLPQTPDESVGVLIAIDTSASMSTLNGAQTRMDRARQEVEIVRAQVANLSEAYPDVRFCESLMTFDSGGIQIQDGVPIDSIEHRALGTATATLRVWLKSLFSTDTQQNSLLCQPTHVVIITDVTAPEWVTQSNVPIIWRDIGTPADNVGIVSIEPRGSELFGWNGSVEVSITAYGTPPQITSITIVDANNNLVDSRDLSWIVSTTQSRTLQLPTAGEYKVMITPNDAYMYDNQATIRVDNFQNIRYSWELPTPLPFDLSTVGWELNPDNPNIRIVPSSSNVTSDIPTIIIGNEYRQATDSYSITYFEEETGLLDRISLDTAQSLRIGQSPFITSLTSDLYTVILADDADNVLIAMNDSAPFVTIPGPPIIDADPELNGFSQTLFFNAVRWLLNSSAITPDLYTNTSNANPIPIGNINVLHDGEGAVHTDNSGFGNFSDITPIEPQVAEDPIWALLLLIAGIMLVFERGLTLFGRHPWN
jgi:hypothetical protein